MPTAARSESFWNGKRRWLAWGLTGLLVLLYFSQMAFKGWIPADEGLLGHTAERVLQGMVPHTDFMDPYTGGLSYLHALAFHVFGASLWAIRVTLLVFSLVAVFIAALVFRSYLAPLPANLLTLLTAAWMTPMYFAGLPSWYVTFCSIFALACFLRYNRTGNRALLVAAGVFGGLAFLVKISGLYLICALLSALVFMPTAETDSAPTASKSSRLLLRATRLMVAIGISATLLMLLRRRLMVPELVLFALPGCAICLTGVIAEVRNAQSAQTIRSLMRELVLLGVGVLPQIRLR